MEPFQVTVSRVNEGERQKPTTMVSAERVTLEADGTLSVHGVAGRVFGPGLWDHFEVKRLVPKTTDA